jgi:hypothetical protein
MSLFVYIWNKDPCTECVQGSARAAFTRPLNGNFENYGDEALSYSVFPIEERALPGRT